jgi:hypothetical protein
MLQILNKTPFETNISIFPDEDGIDAIYPAVKATFNINGDVSLAEQQVPLVESDEYFGEPGSSSMLYASDMMPAKPSTDVFLCGTAYAPHQQHAQSFDVSLKVANRIKIIRVFGDRRWEDGFFGARISEPEPFLEIPLIFEKAFGGKAITKNGEEFSYEFNPVGMGFKHSKGIEPIDGSPLPNLEDPRNLIKNPNQKQYPSLFGPICSSWQPRLQYAGTYDENWQKKRVPYLPDDFNPKFYNAAQPDLIFNQYLEGREIIEVFNASKEGYLKIKLPSISFIVKALVSDDVKEISVNLETICIEPDYDRLTMLWKGKLNCDKKLLKIKIIYFEIENADETVMGL